MSKVEIIGVPQSNYVRVVRMACEEKGIDCSGHVHESGPADSSATRPATEGARS